MPEYTKEQIDEAKLWLTTNDTGETYDQKRRIGFEAIILSALDTAERERDETKALLAVAVEELVNTVELVERIEQTMCGIEGEPGHENAVIDINQAAALIDAYAKQVPEKLLSIIYNMPSEFYSEWLDHAKEICQDFGYTVKEE